MRVLKMLTAKKLQIGLSKLTDMATESSLKKKPQINKEVFGDVDTNQDVSHRWTKLTDLKGNVHEEIIT